MNPISKLDSYASPEAPKGFSRAFPTLSFYTGLTAMLIRDRRTALRGEYKDPECYNSSLRTVRRLEASGVRFHIEGLDHLSNLEKPVIIIGNHMSSLETFALPCMVLPHTGLSFVIKPSLLKLPIFGRVLGAANPIVVTRNNPREDLKIVMEEGTRAVQEGRSVMVFPQHTRSLELKQDQFNSIGVKLAKKAGAMVLPVALKSDAWGLGTIVKGFGAIDPSRDVYFAFGEPMEVTGNGKEQHQAIFDFISRHLEKWTS